MESDWARCVHRHDESVEYRCRVEGDWVWIEMSDAASAKLPREVFDENYEIEEGEVDDQEQQPAGGEAEGADEGGATGEAQRGA